MCERDERGGMEEGTDYGAAEEGRGEAPTSSTPLFLVTEELCSPLLEDQRVVVSFL